MKVRTLRMENFRRHHDTTLEFPDGAIALLGRNGSGKSTILEAIGFALFGTTATRTVKELLRWDRAPPGDPVRVELDCELAGQAVHIERELRGKNLTGTASLTVDGTVQVAGGAGSHQAVTESIERLLGMGQDAFFTTVVARQRELSRLADLGPADRKRLILDMLGVDALDRAIRTARGRARDAKVRVDTLREARPDEKALRVALGEAKSKAKAAAGEATEARGAWQKAHDALAAATKANDAQQTARRAHDAAAAARVAVDAEARQLDARLADVAARLAKAASAATDAERLAPEADRAESLRADLDAIDRATEAAAQRAQLVEERARAVQARDAVAVPAESTQIRVQTEQERAAVAARLREAEREHAVLEATQASLASRLDRLGDGDACPLCEQPLVDAGALHLRLRHDAGAQAEAATARAEEVQRLRAQQKELDDMLADLRAQQERRTEAVAQRTRWTDRVQDLDARLAALPDAVAPDRGAAAAKLGAAQAAAKARERLLALAETRPALQDERVRLRKTSDGLAKRRQAAADDLLRIAFDADAARGAEQAWKDATAAERAADRAAEQARARHEQTQRDVANAAARIEEAAAAARLLAAAEKEHASWTGLADGRGHGLLERFKDHLVARIGPAVSAEASRLLARFTDGRYTEVLLDAEYRLYVSDGGERYTLERFSGGEVDLVHLALRLAVSRLVLDRAGSDLRFLALDEVFGSLDDERRGHVLAALRGLRGLYSQVLLVTHQDALRDALDAVLLVEERDGRAVVTQHTG